MELHYQEYRNILIAIDKFKGSLTSEAAAAAVSRGIGKALSIRETGEDISNNFVTKNRKYNSIVSNIDIVEIADGGDGSSGVLEKYLRTKTISCTAAGPLGNKIPSGYLLYEPAGAFIEMAKVSGLELLAPAERDPLRTTTYGLGELIRHAAGQGVREITLAIGGSATNDGGTGMLQALGYRFLDQKGKDVALSVGGFMNGSSLGSIYRIDASGRYPGLQEIEIKVVCDVSNPLLGPSGATYVYGPQKGASPAALEILEAGMENYARRSESQFYGPDGSGAGLPSLLPGAGAAGGTGYALNFFLNARMIGGKRFFAQLTDLEHRIMNADLVITGEGRLDLQSFHGKVVDGVLELAARYHKKVWIFCGKNSLAEKIIEKGTIHGSGNVTIRETDAGPEALVGKRLEGVYVKSLEELEPCTERSMKNAACLLERLAFDAVLSTGGDKGI